MAALVVVNPNRFRLPNAATKKAVRLVDYKYTLQISQKKNNSWLLTNNKFDTMIPIKSKMEDIMSKTTVSGMEYTIDDEKDQLVITAEGKVPTINKILLGGLLVWFVVYTYAKLGSDSNIPWWVFPFVLVIGAIGGGIGLLIARKGIHKNLGIRKIILNKDGKTVESPSDGFKASFSDIKEITITETKGLFKTVSLLKFQLTNGEKTILFPFTTYNQAQEVLVLLKQNIK